ncbi:MAG: rod shape-determining protein MreC [Pseudomonadota bacterium]|jgi:rod shape-determining protein MreC
MSVVGHQPPPFFKRGPAPVARLAFFVVFSLALLVLDMRFRYLETLRAVVAAALYPAQRAAYTPVELLTAAAGYFTSMAKLREENARLRRREVQLAGALLRQEQLDLENQRLRALLEMKSRSAGNGVVAEILYAARDPFAKRVVIDKGWQDQVAAGQAVVDETGLVGQVTRVYPFMSEVTLISDKNQAVPVQIVRNGLRAVLFGVGDGQLELRFLAANADVKSGDVVVTSGLDGVYLPGLPVAKVARVDRDASFAFARILCVPLGGVEKHNQVLVLGSRPPVAELPVEQRPEEKPAKGRKAPRKE